LHHPSVPVGRACRAASSRNSHTCPPPPPFSRSPPPHACDASICVHLSSHPPLLSPCAYPLIDPPAAASPSVPCTASARPRRQSRSRCASVTAPPDRSQRIPFSVPRRRPMLHGSRPHATPPPAPTPPASQSPPPAQLRRQGTSSARRYREPCSSKTAVRTTGVPSITMLALAAVIPPGTPRRRQRLRAPSYPDPLTAPLPPRPTPRQFPLGSSTPRPAARHYASSPSPQTRPRPACTPPHRSTASDRSSSTRTPATCQPSSKRARPHRPRRLTAAAPPPLPPPRPPVCCPGWPGRPSCDPVSSLLTP